MMSRRLFTTAAVLSLLLFAASILFGIRSLRYVDRFSVSPDTLPYWINVYSQHGSIQFNLTHYTRSALNYERIHRHGRRVMIHSAPLAMEGWDWYNQPNLQWKWAGFAYREEEMGGPRYASNYIYQGVWFKGLAVPYPAIIIASAMLPFFRMPARRRVPAGHCTVCGYDLRASKGWCPECGTQISSK